MILTDDELELIEWRAGRGLTLCKVQPLLGSQYAIQVINQDVPKMLAEIRLQRKEIERLTGHYPTTS